MNQIQIIENPKGVFSCELGVTREEWKQILSDKSITTQSYKDALMAFYNEPGHKSTCKALALKHDRSAKEAQRYNSLITQFGQAVVKELNRFHIIDAEGKERFWPVVMSPGVSQSDGLFEWTLREEVVDAIERLGWNERFPWIPFYEELADKVLAFKDNRKELVAIAYESGFADYIKAQDGGKVNDIDPFTFLGIFNRGLGNENRTKVAKFFKDKLSIDAAVPTEFGGIPTVMNQSATFYWREEISTAMQPLWDLYEAALTKNREILPTLFDAVRKQKGIKWNITMGLYWVRPYEYIALDSVNRKYLDKLGIKAFSESKLDSSHYLALLDTVREKIAAGEIKEKSIPEISYHAWAGNDNVVDNSNMAEDNNNMVGNKYKEYIDILKANYNMILTGAPGTGKTHMAKEIAKAMGCENDEVEFVQFHPSYDYTDFVEGLRPVDDGSGRIGFERKDGVFKKFCLAAIQNIIDSQKSSVERGKELSWREKLEAFVSDAIENETKYKTVHGAEFRIIEVRDNAVVAFNEQNAVTSKVVVSVPDILEMLTKEVKLKNVHDIRNYFNRKHASQSDSYAFVIVRDVRKMKDVTISSSATTVKEKPFVFIIDEINRGEVSKIFGELFYAIDPGYRGDTKVMVKTQYQNLIKDGEPFSDGFYVPKNVYIIGTMNDIDRSVESMDFAMRRRFTWKEVKPEDTQEMLDDLEQADEAKESMNKLNKCIRETDGLGPAYQIGAAYFKKLSNYKGDFEALWNMSIEPLLREYLRGFRHVDETINKFKAAYQGGQSNQEDKKNEDLLEE